MELVEFSVSAPHPTIICAQWSKLSGLLSGQHSCNVCMQYLITRLGAAWKLRQHKDIVNNVQKSSSYCSSDILFKAFF